MQKQRLFLNQPRDKPFLVKTFCVFYLFRLLLHPKRKNRVKQQIYKQLKKKSMATTADIKNGMCIDLDGHYYFITEFLHVKPGKGAAFVRTKMKSVTTGRTLERTFNAGVKIEEVRIERRTFQFLYQDDMGYNFMNQETYDQISVQKELITGVEFLKEGDMVEIAHVLCVDTLSLIHI
eukprot:TRINITY_DN15058_c0_g1_i1.p1 TRINITY_DN15058_c0_g1~~TRINITY_DN15058_c0_g1_i1.p1  ORF type:complete len:178 (+),score=9.54 TRINITY_DN15058_c0_g1_i1:159-692(+)